MEKDKQKNMILEENIWKVMINLSWPAVIAMVLYGLNTVFDAIFVGRYVGETALAGVSLAYPLSQLSLGFGSLVGVGAGSVLSIALGANDHATQKKTDRQCELFEYCIRDRSDHCRSFSGPSSRSYDGRLR